ncbi:MAG: MFS transporter [Planctomycetota bacterium]
MNDQDLSSRQAKWLFVTCFIALIATSFAFIIRALIIDDWGVQFGLSATQKGELFGAGLWPFAISIVLFSLVIDRVGYGKALAFAFACHTVSAVVTILAPTVLAGADATPEEIKAGQDAGYWVLYWGNFIAALGNGTVEAVINPVIATIFWKQKTKWLNILHAGWPAGLIVGGLLTLSLGTKGIIGSNFEAGAIDWRWKVALLLIPTVVYGVMMLKTKFPVNERVAAGVSYRDMLAEMGAIGAFIASSLILIELGRVLGWPSLFELGGYDVNAAWIGIVAITGVYFAYTRSLGRPMFTFLLLLMILLATTELGTDNWIKSLMSPVMNAEFGIDGGWVLIYTATIMMTLRLFCGPIVKALNPLGLLMVSTLFAAAGLVFLSTAAGLIILLAATIYGIGQTFFWPTTLGLVAERFPKGGALTLNAIAGVGMLGVGILGNPLLGAIQDNHIDSTLAAEKPALHEQVMGEEATSVLGSYRPLDNAKLELLSEEDQEAVTQVTDEAKQTALFKVAALPLIMFVCYLLLLIYFKKQGGYQAEQLPEAHTAASGDSGPPE